FHYPPRDCIHLQFNRKSVGKQLIVMATILPKQILQWQALLFLKIGYLPLFYVVHGCRIAVSGLRVIFLLSLHSLFFLHRYYSYALPVFRLDLRRNYNRQRENQRHLQRKSIHPDRRYLPCTQSFSRQPSYENRSTVQDEPFVEMRS